jgi:hypothetical protein
MTLIAPPAIEIALPAQTPRNGFTNVLSSQNDAQQDHCFAYLSDTDTEYHN